MMSKIGLYIHIPFCASKCAYCAFTSFHRDNATIERYIDALCTEIEKTLDENIIVDTMYIGGGTPSILRIDEMCCIVDTVKRCATFDPIEFTVECNPESLTIEKLNAYQKLGVTRISMGVQSLNDDILKTIGRVHTSAVAIEKAGMSVASGLDTSVDMILGLPSSTNDDIKKYIDTFSEIGVHHISAYSLSVEPNSRLERMVNAGDITLPSEDESVDQYEYAYRLLKEHGYNRYEVSNFAKAGHESRHNNKYWQMDEYIGLGLASHSYYGGKRYYNTKNLEEYITNIESGQSVSTMDEELTLRDRVEETIMLGLRLEKGISIHDVNKLIDGDFLIMNAKNIEKLKDFINISNGRLAIRPEYMNVMNSIIVELLE